MSATAAVVTAVASKVTTTTTAAAAATAVATKIAPATARRAAPPLQKSSVKHGIGRLTASAEGILNTTGTTIGNGRNPTRLTRVAHKAPLRLVPIGKSSVAEAGAAICALSNYGAGMLQGDSAALDIRVETGARLGVLTQGANRIYTPRHVGGTEECQATLKATVEKDAFLVLAPDPCALFASAKFSQLQQFHIHPQSSVALIDWFSSGRYMNQEQWDFDNLYTRTSLHWLEENSEAPEESIPFLQDSILMDLRVGRNCDNYSSEDAHGVAGFNCFASLILYGEETQPILERCHDLSNEFAAKHTRIRERERQENYVNNDDVAETMTSTPADHLGLAGRVVMGASRIRMPGNPSDAHVIRLAAQTNEDLYRVFHECLLPVSPCFGVQFYKDRIRAHQSVIANEEKPIQAVEKKPSASEESFKGASPAVRALATNHSTTSEAAFWSIVMLADSGLPTGSFAHSAGLETAAQLGMIQSEHDVENFVNSATRSAMQVSAPFLIAGHQLATIQVQTEGFSERWERLHDQCQAVLATNEPACSASIDQGKSLARIAAQWLKTDDAQPQKLMDQEKVDAILECLKQGSPHVAPTLGVICGVLDLDESQVCQLFAYCVARDLVSAAVRLSLVGPLASVPLLHRVQSSSNQGVEAVASQMLEFPGDPLMAAAASAPVIEALHPCHEILQVRLFRS
ncbi:MAG: hypothetical protein SGILL_000488 [Bacillariaceae sp.]